MSQPEQTKLLCLRYAEVLKEYGFSNIITSDPSWALLPGVHCILIEEKQKNLLICGSRLHFGLPEVLLPSEKILFDLDFKLYSHINYQKSKVKLSEFSGFFVDKNYLLCFSKFSIIQILICFSIGLALRYNNKKLICLSSQHMYMHASFFGFKIMEDFGDNGKIYYPSQHCSYYMECDIDSLSSLRKDVWQLIYWASHNINVE